MSYPQLYTLKKPFITVPLLEIHQAILAGVRPPCPQQVDRHLWGILNWCWHDDARARPKISEVVEELKGCKQRYMDPPHGAVPYQIDTP
jgi:hypothetical protein